MSGDAIQIRRKKRAKRPPFDPEQIRVMILDGQGNVTKIARLIHADSEMLRAFVRATPMLMRAMDEVISRGVDESIQVLFDGLEGEHLGIRLASAKEFLKSRSAQKRGFHHAGDLELKAAAQPGTLTLTWLPPEAEEPKLIEGEGEE